MVQRATAFNLVAVAGGAKNLLNDPAHPQDTAARDHVLYCIRQMPKPTVLSCIDFRFWNKFLNSPELQKAAQESDLVLANHHDCGAYGGFSRFDSHTQEQMFHMGQLGEALKAACANDTKCATASTLIFEDRQFKSSDAHECDALILTCGEDAFWQEALKAAKTKLGYSSFDILATYGGPRMLARPAQIGFDGCLLDNIATSRRLHGIRKGIALIGHEGGTCSMKQSDLAAAHQVVRARFSDLPITTVWLSQDNPQRSSFATPLS